MASVTVRADRPHSGPYASGACQAAPPAVPPLSDDTHVQLDEVYKVIRVAGGVRYNAWTLGGSVPAPTLHGRQGSTLHVSMTNRCNEQPVEGHFERTPPHLHSLSVHGVTFAAADSHHRVPPGQTVDVDLPLQRAGVFMYHCGSGITVEHLAAGEYGMLIVDPAQGYDAPPPDCQFVVVQSEVYARRKFEADDVFTLDPVTCRSGQASYVLFNGNFSSLLSHPLQTAPGQRVRLYLLNAGPDSPSSLAIEGIVFDRVWMDGNPQREIRDAVAVDLPPGRGAIADFVVPAAGMYVLLDHHYANAFIGAKGYIRCGDAVGVGIPDAPEVLSSNLAANRGRLIYEGRCMVCHGSSPGLWPRGEKAPSLRGVTTRRSADWLRRWMRSPESMVREDAQGRALFEQWHHVIEPNQALRNSDIDDLIAYLRWIDKLPVEPAKAPPAETE
jgi:nitrite reductase (NO-forming)